MNDAFGEVIYKRSELLDSMEVSSDSIKGSCIRPPCQYICS